MGQEAAVNQRLPVFPSANAQVRGVFPATHPLTTHSFSTVREKIRLYDEDGDPGAYIRETEFYDTYLAREFTFPEEIDNVQKDVRPKPMLSTPFDPELQNWRDCER